MRNLNDLPPAPRAEHRATTRTAQTALALFGTLQATHKGLHGYCDQVVQGKEAIDKDKPGWVGRRACAYHVTTYTTVQTFGTLAVTRALGYRLPIRALAAGMAINAVTHYVIDRREPLRKFVTSKWAQKLRIVGRDNAGYIQHATVQRREGVVDETGPGTALMELDQGAHDLISVIASLITTCIAVRAGER